jgi:septal ring factor EnvC (AmiA/AmiB activator)
MKEGDHVRKNKYLPSVQIVTVSKHFRLTIALCVCALQMAAAATITATAAAAQANPKALVEVVYKRQNSIEYLIATLEEKQRAIDRLTKENTNLRSKAKTLEGASEGMTARYHHLEQENKALVQDNSVLHERLHEKQQQIEALQQCIYSLTHPISRPPPPTTVDQLFQPPLFTFSV